MEYVLYLRKNESVYHKKIFLYNMFPICENI
jgi:hypothetical protein